MGVVLLMAALAAVAGLACGGRLRGWALLRFRGVAWLVAALAVQVVTAIAAPASSAGQRAALLASLGIAAVVLLANSRIPGMALLGAGCVSNLLVIAVNGAMPVSVSAAGRVGAGIDLAALDRDPRHVLLTEHTRLPFLADVIGIPLPVAPEVVSVGDLLAALGAGLLVWSALRAGRDPVGRYGDGWARFGPQRR